MSFKKFCPKCGKETDQLIDGFCKNCAVTKEKPLVSSIKVHYCSCTRIKEKGKWIQYENINDAIRSIIKNNTKLKHFEIEYSPVIFEGKITLPVTLKSHNNHVIDLIFISHSCDVCSRKAGNYYEGTLQIRGNINQADEIKEYITRKSEEYKDKYENSFLQPAEYSKHGIDIRFGSTKAIMKIIREIRNNFSVTIKHSFELAGMKDGKHMSRKTILIRIE